MSNTFLDRQVEIRQQVWDKAKALLDAAAAEKRDLTADETQTYDRYNSELAERADTIKKIQDDEQRELRLDAATREIADQVRQHAGPAPVENDDEIFRKIARGEMRSYTFEKRDIGLTSTIGSPIPTSFYDQLVLQARLVGPMLQTSTILNTNSGENLQIPSQSAWSTAAITGPGTAIGESDPQFNAFTTLGAFKYGAIVQVTRELLEDSGVDIIGFLATQFGNALGTKVNNDLTVGGGTTAPWGIVTRSSVGGTSTSGTGVFTADDLINLFYSLDGAAAKMPGVGWQMRRATAGAVRKLKDTAGYYIWSPALAVGAADSILGAPVYENPAVAAVASAAKEVIVGDLKSYFVRQVGGVKLERSDEFAFSTDLITFKATMRVDGDLPQVTHVKHLLGA